MGGSNGWTVAAASLHLFQARIRVIFTVVVDYLGRGPGRRPERAGVPPARSCGVARESRMRIAGESEYEATPEIRNPPRLMAQAGAVWMAVADRRRPRLRWCRSRAGGDSRRSERRCADHR